MKTGKDKPLPVVRVGQVWRSNDKRDRGRLVRVVKIHDNGDSLDGYVTVERVVKTWRGDFVPEPSIVGALFSRIRIDRMRPTATGYVLVSDVEDK